jgi:spore coat protein U-like protein
MFLNQRASLLFGTMLTAGVAAAPGSPRADQINVSATITATCELDGDANLAFGNYNPQGGTPGSTTLIVSCTAPSDVGVTLGPGQNPNGGGALRHMKHGTQSSALLGYQLFDGGSLGGSGDPWAKNQEIVFDIGTDDTQIEIGGFIPGSQGGLPSGSYTDVVLVTLDVK